MGPIDINNLLQVVLKDELAHSSSLATTLPQSWFINFQDLIKIAEIIQTTYALERNPLADALEKILCLDTVHILDEHGVRWALYRYRHNGIELSDMLEVIAAKGATRLI